MTLNLTAQALTPVLELAGGAKAKAVPVRTEAEALAELAIMLGRTRATVIGARIDVGS